MTSFLPDLRSARRSICLLTIVCLWLLGASQASAATFVVDLTSDAATPSDCTAAPADCTLRGAIDLSNVTTGEDEIEFDGAISSIGIDSPLPAVTENLIIRGGGVALFGSLIYTTSCTSSTFALSTLGARLKLESLPVFDVCAAAVSALQPAPTLRVGPRRADNTVAISGEGTGQVELYRTTSPAAGGEATATYQTGVNSPGSFAFVPGVEPAAGERFAATLTSEVGGTSNFSVAAETPWDLVSPTIMNVVAIANNAVRADFSEAISPAVNGHPEFFSLSMGGLGREVTHVMVDGKSVYLHSLTTPWNTGEAGELSFTGNGRVSDATFGNELVGQPSIVVFAGPGEVTAGTVTKGRVSPRKFCQLLTRKCNKRIQTYLYFSLNKDSRVTLTVYKAKNHKFVLRQTRRLSRGQQKTRLFGTINGRRIPTGWMYVRIVAEDNARNLSAPVDVRFKVVNRNKQL